MYGEKNGVIPGTKLNIVRKNVADSKKGVKMITVFYDGACSMCNREIGYYQKISPPAAFSWININDPEFDEHPDIDKINALKLLHVKDSHGKIHIGVDGFIMIWSKLKYFKILAFICQLPIIYGLIKKIYQLFAKWRFKKLDY